MQPTFISALFFYDLEKSGGGGGPKKSNAYNRFMKSELKKLKEEFPDLDHVERSVPCPHPPTGSYAPPPRFKMGAANWHKKKEEREAVKAKD